MWPMGLWFIKYPTDLFFCACFNLQEAEELSKSSKQRTTYTGETTVQKRTKISEINKPFRNKDKKLKPRDFIRMRKERKKQAANT